MTADARSDGELIAAFARGDAAAFEVLYLRHRDWVAGVARRFCGDEGDALDAMQEAFLYLIRRAPQLDLRHRLTTFLYPVVKHLAADRRRLRSRGPAPLDRADEPFEQPGLPGDVREWFVGLGPLQQEVLTLRYADGLDLGEIAIALDVPVGTVKSRLHNAMRQLRENLAGQ